MSAVKNAASTSTGKWTDLFLRNLKILYDSPEEYSDLLNQQNQFKAHFLLAAAISTRLAWNPNLGALQNPHYT